MIRFVLALGIALAVSGCASADDPHRRTVTREDYGASWPLSEDDAVLSCEADGRLLLTTGGESEQIGQVDLDAPGDQPVITMDWLGVADTEPDLGYLDLLDDAAALCG